MFSIPRAMLGAPLTWVMCTVLAPARVEAQSPMGEDSLLRRVRSLDSVVAVRRQTVDSVRRSLVRVVPQVVVTSGALSIRTTPELESRIRAAAALAAKTIDDAGSSGLPSRVASHLLVVTRDSTAVGFGFVPVISLAPDTTRRRYGMIHVNVSLTATAAQIADRLSMFVEQYAGQGIDRALSGWLMMERLPLRPTSNTDAQDVYIELAANESAAARRCRSGDVSACLDVFGLDSSNGSRLSRWYAPEDYRSLVRRVAPPRDDSVAVAAWLRCRDDRNQDACVTAARALPEASVPFPLSATARRMLVRTAFELGGAGAYDRLIAPTGDVRARIAAAAQQPAETVVRRWLASVETARPNPMKIRAGATLASLGWCGFFLAVGMTRRRSCA